ncbi:Protein kinase-like (PK-like) [Venustampulla echinocandica]|uniref:non-specific serine/threonine protein kinase n=1 Tax=Venustampulla echinocandica TaxID=2656787 RepID=A0A370TYQ1_9HELO|nr:Protein kinase-like (PK-like) [Venustampulla echinocandica]RDL40654.1 Protein kinase-like (PK-like) [Venustampulla echinocandica]
MASYDSAMPATAHRPAVFGAPVPMTDPTAPPGTFAPGTKIQVGNHKVVIQKYFSEGGFAHVYLVKMPKPVDGTDIAILKRVAVPDKENLANMRTEVETMKKLKGHRPIVTYYDSHASQLKGGGYEVFLLMEFCNGGGLIDFMNTRLQNRLTEPEILKIFSDVAEGVACMHYLKPPLLHRDLKVENVLITSAGKSNRFKLCDFGSTAPPRPAATTASECRLIEDDVQKHTTLQYRSPEMIDVYRKQPIDEKSDIWALGVLLYKLCYYTTPFEAQGQLAILNASFKFPSYPHFSDNLKKLIASMLREHPKSRPNIYQVLREACLMQGIEVPIKDIYSGRTASEARRNQQLPSPSPHVASPPTVGAVFSPPTKQQQVIPDVVPMRRGRPTTSAKEHTPKPSPSPMRGTSSDPFAALDAKAPPGPVDEISNRFPSLDQFTLLHDAGKFDFEASSPAKSSQPRDLSQRVTEKLADDAFALPPKEASSKPSAPAQTASSKISRAQKIISSNPELQSVASPQNVVYQPTPSRPKTSVYVSQGTMTSTTPPLGGQQPAKYGPSPVYRFPATSDHHRSASLPRNQEATTTKGPLLRPGENQTLHARSASRGHARHASSSRPSLEGGRPSSDALDPIARTKSSNARPRPTSTYLESNIDYLREKESSGRSSMENRPLYTKPLEAEITDQSPDETNIESNVDFLRTMEDNDSTKKDRRRSSGANNKSKRSSLPSLSGTKNLLAGKFGDAFKRFETNASSPPPRTPSPLQDMERKELTPIAGSEATDGRSDDGMAVDDMENMAPEQRRELERRRLSMEEARVANAAAEYRRRLAERGPPTAPRSIGGVSRAASIQNKVKTLLDENQHSPKKTAEGYGRYTNNSGSGPAPKQFEHAPINPYGQPAIPRKPIVHGTVHARTMPLQNDLDYPRTRPQPNPATVSRTGGPKPNAPPKPMHLNSISTGPRSHHPQNSPPKSTSLPTRPIQARPDMTPQEKEDYMADFSKRFPSLSGIEMVERDIEKEDRGVRTKEI